MGCIAYGFIQLVIKSLNMNIEVLLLIISASFSVGVFVGVAKVSWVQDDMKTEIREIKNKLNSL